MPAAPLASNWHAREACRRFLPLAIALGAWLGLSSSVSGQSVERRQAHAERTAVPPTIDGVVEEESWFTAEVLTDFVQAEPIEGQPASERTEVRLLYDDVSLYVGVVCHDSDPSQIVVTDARRDSSLQEMDSFQIILDTYLDRQNGFVFGTNPAGLEYDGQVSNEGEGGSTSSRQRVQTGIGGGFNLNWDASFVVESRIHEAGWSAEFSIPLRSLRYGASKPYVWGINFQRNIRRKREEVYWSPVSRIFNLFRLSSAGDLTGLDLATPRNFKVTPFATSTANRDYGDPASETEVEAEFGVDAKFGITPSLNLDLTYNTDFAQVEVDDQQINLTRFNLFFPEKRPFFLENAGSFSMGTGNFQGRAVEVFFSRRIGIHASGNLVPIQGGARLSGKLGSYNLGALNMQTERVAGITPANNFTVASLSREFPNRSSLGVLFVNRQATGRDSGDANWNRTWGVDGKIGVGNNFTLTGFAARTETPGATGRERAVDVFADYKTLGGQIWAEYTEVGSGFNPEVGFLLRENYRSVQGSLLKNIRLPGISWFRETRPHFSYREFWDFTGFKQTEFLHFDSHMEFENGAFFSPAVNLTLEGLKQPFEIAEGVVIPPGSYRNKELAWRWNTDQSAVIFYDGSLDYGGFFSGDRASIGTTISVNYGSNINASLTWSYNDIDLPQGSFVTNLALLRVNYSFTPLVSLRSLIQYNDQADTWAANIRFSWLNTAGTGLFVVYNDTEGLGDRLIGPQNRSFIIKYTRQFDILK